jgi:diphthamide biosynthesis enzyme Dph1/Dph2-like protein
MNIHYIQARYIKNIILPSEILPLLPKKLILTTTIQYFNSLLSIKKQLEENNISVNFLQGRRRTYDGQILGCMTPYRYSDDAETILYIGDGQFHPKALLINNSSKVIAYNPKSQEIKTYTSQDVALIKQKIKAVYIQFLQAKNVGVLLSVKNGQSKPELTNSLQERYPEKCFYFFADNTYDFSSLENFPFIEVYLNTMCERIALDDALEHKLPIINVEDLFSFEKDL